MRTLALISLLLLSACDSAAPPRADGLHMDGLEGARVGMTLTEAEAALGPLVAPSGVESDACFYAKSETHPGVLVMMTGGALQRIDVREGATTPPTPGFASAMRLRKCTKPTAPASKPSRINTNGSPAPNT